MRTWEVCRFLSTDITQSRLNAIIQEEHNHLKSQKQLLITRGFPKALVDVILSYLVDPNFPQILLPKESYITKREWFLYEWALWFHGGDRARASMNARAFLHCTFQHFADKDGRWKSQIDIGMLQQLLVWHLGNTGLELEVERERYTICVLDDKIALKKDGLILLTSSCFMDLMDFQLKYKDGQLQFLFEELPEMLTRLRKEIDCISSEIEKCSNLGICKQIAASLGTFFEFNRQLNGKIEAWSKFQLTSEDPTQK